MDALLKILLVVVVAVTAMWVGVLSLLIFLILVRCWKNTRPATNTRPERLAEIASWLQKRTTPEEAIATLEAFDASAIKGTVRQQIVESLFLLLTGLWMAGVFWRTGDGP